MGILDFVEAADERLFPLLMPKAVSEWFNSPLRNTCDIPDVNDLEERLSFHSFRATVITKLRGNGFTDVQVQQVVGHKKTSAGITDVYTKSFQIKVLVKVVDSLNYE